jgi:D-alanyl-D-alanine-carboxypeptidase/D-alanyl-D-alanine-endopeptidase
LGLPREGENRPEETVPTAERSKEDYVNSLKSDPLLFAPGAGILYSNFSFDMLAQALAQAGGKPYPELLKERVLDPAGLKDTRFDLPDSDKSRAMQGHNFDGSPMPFVPTSPMIVGAGGFYSAANDMLRWLKWHLDRFSPKESEMRLASVPHGRSRAHGLHGSRLGGDGARRQSAADRRCRATCKASSFVAMAPTRGVAVFVSINEFSVSGFDAVSRTAIELITEPANR